MIVMGEKPTYFDTRSEFWKKYWDRAKDFHAFLGGASPEHAARWRDAFQRTPELGDEDVARLQGYNRELNVLAYGGTWCMDCARTGPILKKIVDVAGARVRLRFIEREASVELQDELRILGGLRTPVVVFFSEDWWEVDRYGDRTLSVYRSRAAREIGRGVDTGLMTPEALQSQTREWVDVFERVLLMLRLAPYLRKKYND